MVASGAVPLAVSRGFRWGRKLATGLFDGVVTFRIVFSFCVQSFFEQALLHRRLLYVQSLFAQSLSHNVVAISGSSGSIVAWGKIEPLLHREAKGRAA